MILGIETSTPRASLALLDGGAEAPVWEASFETERAHNAVIFDPVSEMLSRYREEISGIAVGLGPGSYGGVRVGIAVANGLSMILDVPLLGVSSLEAWKSDEADYTVLGDARRKTFFVARLVSRVLQCDPELLPEDVVIEQVGRSMEAGEGDCFTADRKVADAIDGVRLSYPTAVGVAIRAQATALSEWSRDVVLEPHYLRAPYITTPKAK
ncbi:MAG: tRNA (adenosine(37)-N6)-threonylcarbamoyltransferase complex dimerization subunit type 1 TsaB [Verrucomicrobiales bacterium]|nr:tRNA (adenosine(37)-N6)-threonylcarbamoyltransferase complex dimerization subunit type 1 TsaB [Verrucomicrobiales bacterium]